MEIIRQLVLAFLGAVGFSLIFGVKRQLVLPASAGGLLCWGVYLAGLHKLGLSLFLSSFLSAAFTEGYAVCLAKKLKTPATVLFTPAIVPLIPGSGLYYMMSCAVNREWEQARSYGYDTLLCALGIALGMSIVCAFCEMSVRIQKKYRPGWFLKD